MLKNELKNITIKTFLHTCAPNTAHFTEIYFLLIIHNMKSESMSFIVLCTVKKKTKTRFLIKYNSVCAAQIKKAKHSFSHNTHFMFHFLWPIDQLYQHLSTMTSLNINTSQESQSWWSVKPAKPASIVFTFFVRRERACFYAPYTGSFTGTLVLTHLFSKSWHYDHSLSVTAVYWHRLIHSCSSGSREVGLRQRCPALLLPCHLHVGKVRIGT